MDKKNKIRITAFILSIMVFQTGLAFASPVEMLTEDIHETLELTEDFSDARDSVSADEPVNAEKKDEVVAIEEEKEGDFSVGAEEISGKDEAPEKEETPESQKNSSGISASEQLKMPEPTADAADVKKDEKAELKEVSVENWWSALKNGDKFDIGVKLFKWPYKEPPSFSMGNGALTGTARLVKEQDTVYAEIDFQAIDMGSTVGHLLDFWYIENQEAAKDSESVEKNAGAAAGGSVVSVFIDKFGKKCEYVYGKNKYIQYVRMPLTGSNERVTAGLESDFKAMGRQLCVLNFDFTNAIEKITGQKIERVKQVGAPVISSVLSAEGDKFEISAKIPKTSDASDADIYYTVSVSDEADLSGLVAEKNKYNKTFELSMEDVKKLGSADGTFNVYAVGVKDGYVNSVINMKKMTFDPEVWGTPAPTGTAVPDASAMPTTLPTTSPSVSPSASPSESPTNTEKPEGSGNTGDDDDESGVKKNGKYRVSIALYNASSNQKSMGNVAFENNDEALITTSGGKSVIRMASNPVSIPPYYSALKDMQFENKSGQWQQVKAVKRATIKANDGTSEHSLSYLQMFEFEIPDTDEEFIPVKINVPYTPMDDIVENDGGYIEARIKINWKTLEKTDSSDELEPNDEDAAGSSKYASGGSGDDEEKNNGDAVDTTDKKTGIRIQANKFVFPSETEFTVSASDSGKEYDSVKALLGDAVTGFKLYEINASSGKKEAKPTGFAKLYFPVGDYDTAKTVIYRITEETKTAKAGKTQLEYELSEDGKYYVISASALGLFAVGQTDKALATPTPTAAPDNEQPNETDKASAFADITNHWARDIINKAAEIGLFEGVDDTHFAPELETTRGMFVTVFGRIKGVDKSFTGESKYSDVKASDYYCPYVAWADENKIMSGVSESEFAPHLEVTREQMAAVICNFASREEIVLKTDCDIAYTDKDAVSDWARDEVSAVIKAGIMKPGDSGEFMPKEHMTRAQLAELIVDFLSEYMPEKLNEQEEEA